MACSGTQGKIKP